MPATSSPGRRRAVPSGGQRQPRRSPQVTRELMLQAATELIAERAQATGDDVLAAAVAHVRLTQVAERATALVRAQTGDTAAKAITTGAIYQQWPAQADFQVDLLLHIARLQSALVPDLAASAQRFRRAAADGVPWADVLAETMEEVHRHYREDPMYRVELSFLFGANDPRLARVRTDRQAAFYESADAAYRELLDAYRLRVRAPFTLRDLSRAIAAQIAGAVVVWFADPGILDDPLGEPDRSLLSRTVVAIVSWLTEPDG